MEGMDPDDDLSPVERRIEKSFEDDVGVGKPLSRRTRQTRRTVESYLKGGVLPRYMERMRDIERETQMERTRIERIYRALRDEFAGDPAVFGDVWRARARSFSFDKLNELIRQHNEWYPVESGLPMDPRTRDYVRIRGRSYRRRELDPGWVLEQFPPVPAAAQRGD
jgi:hypothetical protein